MSERFIDGEHYTARIVGDKVDDEDTSYAKVLVKPPFDFKRAKTLFDIYVTPAIYIEEVATTDSVTALSVIFDHTSHMESHEQGMALVVDNLTDVINTLNQIENGSWIGYE